MGFWSDSFGGGNSFEESVANTFTPNDGYSYERGDLINESTGKVATKADRAASGKGRADNEDTNRTKYESRPNVPKAEKNPDGSSTDRPVTGIQSLLPMLGGITLGPVGVAAGLTYNRYNTPQSGGQSGSNTPSNESTDNPRDAALLGRVRRYNAPSRTEEELTKARESGNRIQGSYYRHGDDSTQFKMNMFGNSYEINPATGNSLALELATQKNMQGGDDGGISGVRRSAGTQATAPTSTMPAISTESEFAKQQIISPPAEWLIANGYSNTNPSYEALTKYNTDLRAGIVSMARGGEVEFALGGNEKDLLNAMENVVRKDLADDGEFNPANMSDEDKIVIAQFVQQYGVDAIPRLVERIQDGSINETRERFARGENGEVRGNGDGSGVDDMVTAQLKDGDATQDVLLADGEFVLRKDATQAIEKKYGGGALDKINNAGPDAAKELRRLMPT